MSKITPFRKKDELHVDMKEYTRKLFQHRAGVAGGVAAWVVGVWVFLGGLVRAHFF